MLKTDHEVVLGKSGENYACMELERLGYEILHRRFRTRIGEIDVVARDGETLVFIEVKARRSGRFGPPAEAVGPQKRHKLMQMATSTSSHSPRQRAVPLRRRLGDVRRGGAPAEDRVFKGAFDANG